MNSLLIAWVIHLSLVYEQQIIVIILLLLITLPPKFLLLTTAVYFVNVLSTVNPRFLRFFLTARCVTHSVFICHKHLQTLAIAKPSNRIRYTRNMRFLYRRVDVI